MISLATLKISTPLQYLPKNAKGFEKLRKVKYIAQSGHTDLK